MNDPFENHLSKLQRTEVPSHWREEILAAAIPEKKPYWLDVWTRLLAPQPLAWGALAAAWVLICFLNFSGPRGPRLYAFEGPPPSIEVLILNFQTNLLAQAR